MQKKETQPSGNFTVPKCVGIIMDGNRRWAKKHSLPTMAGHKKGYENLEKAAKWAKDLGIQYLIVYAFSTENWNRKKEEIKYLINLFQSGLNNLAGLTKKEQLRVKFIGDLSQFPTSLQKKAELLEAKSAQYKRATLVVALSYGGRTEIVEAVKKVLRTPPSTLTEEIFSSYLWTKDIPDPDFIIRTGGEMRLSNFLLWQVAYSELVFSDVFWPDFTKKDFEKALLDFSNRERRKGI